MLIGVLQKNIYIYIFDTFEIEKYIKGEYQSCDLHSETARFSNTWE